MLASRQLRRGGSTEPADPAFLLAEERRLFYVAITRARSRLEISAVFSPEEDGERPSRFLAELGLPIPETVAPGVAPLTLPDVVARLRCVAVDPDSSPELRDAAVTRLARLAGVRGEDGVPLVPAADPASWWGTRQLSVAPEPPYPPDRALALSGTSLAGLETCPLQWLLGHELHADTTTSPAMGIGLLLHALAEDVAAGRRPPDVDALMATVDEVWTALAFEAPWYAQAQRASVREGIRRFLAWADGPERDRRRLAGVEVGFEITLDLPAGQVRLRGRADRVEVDAAGRIMIVDLKTGEKKPSAAAVNTNPQLGIYQLAAARGAFDVALPELAGRSPGGAELLSLRAKDTRAADVARQRPLDPDELAEGTTWIEGVLDGAARRLLAEAFPPSPGAACEYCAFTICCPARPEGRQVFG